MCKKIKNNSVWKKLSLLAEMEENIKEIAVDAEQIVARAYNNHFLVSMPNGKYRRLGGQIVGVFHLATVQDFGFPTLVVIHLKS